MVCTITKWTLILAVHTRLSSETLVTGANETLTLRLHPLVAPHPRLVDYLVSMGELRTAPLDSMITYIGTQKPLNHGLTGSVRFIATAYRLLIA